MSEMNNTPPEITPGDRHPDYKGRDRGAAARQPCARAAEKQARGLPRARHRRGARAAAPGRALPALCPARRADAGRCARIHRDDMPTYLEELGIRKKLEILPLLDPSTAADYLKGLERAQLSALVDLMDDDVKARPVVSELVRRGRDRQPHDHRLCQHPCRHDRASGDEGADPAGRRHRQHLHALRRRRKRRARRRDRPQGS